MFGFGFGNPGNGADESVADISNKKTEGDDGLKLPIESSNRRTVFETGPLGEVPNQQDPFTTAPLQDGFDHFAGESIGGFGPDSRPVRIKRGFSFNLEDLEEGAESQMHSLALGGPQGTGARRWNPLDGIGRNWQETLEEKQRCPLPSAAPGLEAGLADAVLPYSLRQVLTSVPGGLDVKSVPGQLGGPLLGNADSALQDHLLATQNRAAALKAKIAQLENELAGVPKSQDRLAQQSAYKDVYLRITVPRPLDGTKLGLAVKDLRIASITDARALQLGWAVGDRILAVNNQPITSTLEFSRELAKAMDTWKMYGHPLVFEIVRQDSPQMPFQEAPRHDAILAPSASFQYARVAGQEYTSLPASVSFRQVREVPSYTPATPRAVSSAGNSVAMPGPVVPASAPVMHAPRPPGQTLSHRAGAFYAVPHQVPSTAGLGYPAVCQPPAGTVVATGTHFLSHGHTVAPTMHDARMLRAV